MKNLKNSGKEMLLNGARHSVKCDVVSVPVFLLCPPWLLMMVGKFNQSSINLHNTNDDTVRQAPASLTCHPLRLAHKKSEES